MSVATHALSRVLIVSQNATRTSVLEEGLRVGGSYDIIVLHTMQTLVRRIVEIDPDVVLVDLGNPHDDVLFEMLQISRSMRRPIALFVDHASTDMIRDQSPIVSKKKTTRPAACSVQSAIRREAGVAPFSNCSCRVDR